ncbi:hypothetical protein HZF05_00555 [Sphingomonas sp. CGMCC 1.13654]|uniref:Uncharacterized protein n=1 Tax=Sphingomonas chungangi TaxID=2683589 RepID=A0A838L223_9SPHN|nr:hypothetical protein [Sphingomonas chungangi]MBA2932572.1 hypothetical protein [Sphingomonas chungangi]MVW56195.1 hypothetical protein [Sphingomonas chungangi]
MRSLLLLLLGLVAGAVLFHLYYLGLTPTHRCAWDHPIDASAHDACVSRASFTGYANGARKALDHLIDDVSH